MKHIALFLIIISVPFFQLTVRAEDQSLVQQGTEKTGDVQSESGTADSSGLQEGSVVPLKNDSAPVAEPEPSGETSKSKSPEIEPAIVPAAAQKKSIPEPVNVQDEALNDSGDLSFRMLQPDEGYFRYSRIPGIVIDRAEPETVASTAASSIERVKGGDEADEKSGFLGLGGKNSDVLAKIGLLVFIAAIIILYKLRSASGGRRVMRSIRK